MRKLLIKKRFGCKSFRKKHKGKKRRIEKNNK